MSFLQWRLILCQVTASLTDGRTLLCPGMAQNPFYDNVLFVPMSVCIWICCVICIKCALPSCIRERP